MNQFIRSANDLVTTPAQIRAGFLAIALEKNAVADPYVKNALAFKSMVTQTHSPDDLLNIPQIQPFMLTAAGLSDKSQNYLTESDKITAIKELIEKFLKPAGRDYIDETIYRYLLIKGDAVGGTMRNRIGALGQERLIRCLLSCMNVRGIKYQWVSSKNNLHEWLNAPSSDAGIEKEIKALSWQNGIDNRLLCFNMTLSVVKKNVDICLFSANTIDYANGKIGKEQPLKAIMLGELKSGIDPAGADEHWKTGNTALERIRNSYHKERINVQTSFIAAAIAKSMAQEIFAQLQQGTLSNAANLTNIDQLVDYCNWLLSC